MKIKSLISVILSSLLMVSIGHNIIPHHQHLDDILSHISCHHHESGLQAGVLHDHFGAKENPCQHCHAFNGLNYLISFGIRTELISRIDNQLPWKYFICLNRETVPYFSGFLIETSGLRAPPHSA